VAFPASVGDKFQVRVVGRMEGQETNNVLHFTALGGIDDVELRLIVALADCFITHILPVATSAWTLEKFVWKKVNPALGVEVHTTPAGVGPGAGAAAALPSYCSAVLSIRTSEGGRSKRGRMYLPGIPEAATLVSSFDTSNAYWTAVVAFAGCLATKFLLNDLPGANQFQMLIYSRKLGGSAFPYNNAGFTSVKSILPVQQLGTTRSRKVGVGA
jgi:hypothetical protein